MKLNKTILATAAIVLPLTIGTGSALAYFTANDAASGGYMVEVGPPQTDIEETFDDWTKHVVIKNNGEMPVYVRVKAISGYDNNSNLTYPEPGAGWRDGKDGYYYYDPVLKAKGTEGDKTTPLHIKIGNVPAGATDKEAFNVIVVYERTPAVKEDEAGKIVPDWTYKIVEQSSFPEKTETSASDGDKTDTGEDTGNQPEEQEGGNKG